MDDPDDDEQLTVTVAVEGDCTAVITVVGEIDMGTVETVRSAITHAVDDGARRLVFDLSGVGFIDSSGIAALLESRALVGSVALRKPSNIVRRVIETTGLNDVLVVEA
jgi:anti-sigma B factor antagonist